MSAPIRRFGPYMLLGAISRGGTADVYLAEHLVTSQRVALKVLERHANDYEMVARLLAEHTISQRAAHPGLMQVLGAGCDQGGLPYAVMELLDGENLGSLADRGLLEVDAVIAIGRQIADAVAALHAAGIVHCDLKPDNVFVLYETNPDGWPRVKVLDYGVARLPEDPPCPAGTIAGTPHYMAPEQWHARPVDKSDVYALGCMLYELCTGEPPFCGTLPQLMTSHVEALPVRPSMHRTGIPHALERVILRMLAKDPTLRPTMTEVGNELAMFGGEQLRAAC